jgi:hypothetical protein
MQQGEKSFQQKKLDLDLRKKPVTHCICSIALYGAETWTVRKVDKKYLGNYEM